MCNIEQAGLNCVVIMQSFFIIFLIFSYSYVMISKHISYSCDVLNVTKCPLYPCSLNLMQVWLSINFILWISRLAVSLPAWYIIAHQQSTYLHVDHGVYIGYSVWNTNDALQEGVEVYAPLVNVGIRGSAFYFWRWGRFMIASKATCILIATMTYWCCSL